MFGMAVFGKSRVWIEPCLDGERCFERGVAASQSALRRVLADLLVRRLKTFLKRVAPEEAQQLKAALATPIDWKQTKAFGVQMYTPFGGIRVNLAGREPGGIVPPGGEYEALRDAILEALRPVRDGEGRAVIRNAWRREDVFPEGVAEEIPDVIFEVAPEFIPSSHFFDRPSVVTPLVVKSLTGVHAMDGIFLATGPGVKRGERIAGAEIVDLAPTILYALGRPIPSDMDGKVLLGAFTEE